ncbi:hypothetical protein LTS09_018002 [Friedmanniomyces endolithicus]|nr:hypothetical protein LTS09_018002 [Friedmanniomyces endolithicus]
MTSGIGPSTQTPTSKTKPWKRKADLPSADQRKKQRMDTTSVAESVVASVLEGAQKLGKFRTHLEAKVVLENLKHLKCETKSLEDVEVAYRVDSKKASCRSWWSSLTSAYASEALFGLPGQQKGKEGTPAANCTQSRTDRELRTKCRLERHWERLYARFYIKLLNSLWKRDQIRVKAFNVLACLFVASSPSRAMKRYTVEEVDVLAETTSCRLLTYENCTWEDIDPSSRFDPLTLLQTKNQSIEEVRTLLNLRARLDFRDSEQRDLVRPVQRDGVSCGSVSKSPVQRAEISTQHLLTADPLPTQVNAHHETRISDSQTPCLDPPTDKYAGEQQQLDPSTRKLQTQQEEEARPRHYPLSDTSMPGEQICSQIQDSCNELPQFQDIGVRESEPDPVSSQLFSPTGTLWGSSWDNCGLDATQKDLTQRRLCNAPIQTGLISAHEARIMVQSPFCDEFLVDASNW